MSDQHDFKGDPHKCRLCGLRRKWVYLVSRWAYKATDAQWSYYRPACSQVAV